MLYNDKKKKRLDALHPAVWSYKHNNITGMPTWVGGGPAAE